MVSRVYEEAGTGDLRLQVDHFGEQYRVCCPFCPDTRKRLYINHRWGLFDERTRSKNLWLAKCYNEDCLKCSLRRRSLYNDVFDDFADGTEDMLIPGTKP